MHKIFSSLKPIRQLSKLQSTYKGAKGLASPISQDTQPTSTDKTFQHEFLSLQELVKTLPNDFLNALNSMMNPHERLSIAGFGSMHSFQRESQRLDNHILLSKSYKDTVEGSADHQRAGIKSGTTQVDPTGASQKPIAEEPGSANQNSKPSQSGSYKTPAKYSSVRTRFDNVPTNAVPSSSLSRAFEFAGLGLKLATSALGGKITGSSKKNGSMKENLMNDKNADLISKTLCRMRGIPLKLGQTLSIQEDNLIPKAFKDALERAQRAADVMPNSQVDQMLAQELGADWRSKFQQFDDKPIAAASIGQVHKAITKDGVHVAVKVQYPGVAESIDSDLNNVKKLITYLNLLPKTMYVDQLLKSTRDELAEECDYIVEAKKQMEMRDLLKKEKGYFVPAVLPDLSTRRVLTSEWVDGIGLDECDAVLTQEEKDRLGHRIFHLVLTQLFEYRYLQTDPNPANYFYNPELDLLSLIDYGAATRYNKDFVSAYLDVLYGASTKNKDLVYEASKQLGFLTGEESREMKDAHCASVMIVGEPFADNGPFDFGNQNMTARIYEKIPYMVKNRLKAPPREVYSLHRVLSGTFLACIKLKAKVNVGRIFKEIYTEALPELKSGNKSN